MTENLSCIPRPILFHILEVGGGAQKIKNYGVSLNFSHRLPSSFRRKHQWSNFVAPDFVLTSIFFKFKGVIITTTQLENPLLSQVIDGNGCLIPSQKSTPLF